MCIHTRVPCVAVTHMCVFVCVCVCTRARVCVWRWNGQNKWENEKKKLHPTDYRHRTWLPVCWSVGGRGKRVLLCVVSELGGYVCSVFVTCILVLLLFLLLSWYRCRRRRWLWNILHDAATHCNTLQHTAAHCSTLLHTAPYYIILQHTATHCNTRQHTAAHCDTPQQHCSTLKYTEVYCSTLQQNATHCNTQTQMEALAGNYTTQPQIVSWRETNTA